MSLYQDAAGTIPALLPGDPVGKIVRAAGTVDATQATQASKPTLARHPKGGVRNLAVGAQGVAAASPWAETASASGITATKVGTGSEGGVPYVDIRFAGTASGAQLTNALLQSSTHVPAGVGDTFTARLTARVVAGSATGINGLSINLREIDAAAAFLGGTSTAQITGTADETQSATRTCSQALVDRVAAVLILSLVNGATIDVTYRIKNFQLERGAVSTPLQHNYGINNITEPGVPSIWHLYNDGGDSINVTLPAGECGLAWVDVLGAVTVTTVTSDGTTPINLLRTTRMADVLIRQGALSAVEINELTAYWEGRFK